MNVKNRKNRKSDWMGADLRHPNPSLERKKTEYNKDVIVHPTFNYRRARRGA